MKVTGKTKSLVNKCVGLFIVNNHAEETYLHFYAMGFWFGQDTATVSREGLQYISAPEFADLCIVEYRNRVLNSK
jgi:hypothetical protein